MARWAPQILFLLAAFIVFAGQHGLDLLTVDDLREAEVAREMLETRDVVVPHLAGRPFVEKPPGYQIILAGSYLLAGMPSATAARFAAATFAFLSLMAVYVLGRRVSGPLAGGMAALVLATSVCFCRTAHTLLLDNALTAALAWAYTFAWFAFETPEGWAKHAWTAASLFAAGVAFLFKGFVGPAVYGAGLLCAAAASGRWRDLKPFFNPILLVAFLVPVGTWVIPFVLRAPPPLQREFFITNHFGRALHAYDSHSRPVYFYLVTLWVKFAPGSLLLPLAGVAAWKERRTPQGKPGIFLLAVAAGGLALLSFSRAKDDTYLLPIYPCLSCLVSAWAIREVDAWKGPAFGAITALCLGSILVTLATISWGSWVGGILGTPLAATLLVASSLPWLAHALRTRNPRQIGAITTGMVALTALLACVPPISSWYMIGKNPKPTLQLLLAAAGDRDLLLYRTEDRLRGGCGFFRNRTALEVTDPAELVGMLKNPRTVAVIVSTLSNQKELLAEAARAGVTLTEEMHVDWAGLKAVSLVRQSSADLPRRIQEGHP